MFFFKPVQSCHFSRIYFKSHVTLINFDVTLCNPLSLYSFPASAVEFLFVTQLQHLYIVIYYICNVCVFEILLPEFFSLPWSHFYHIHTYPMCDSMRVRFSCKYWYFFVFVFVLVFGTMACHIPPSLLHSSAS